MTLEAHIGGIGLLGPGLSGWPAAQAIFNGREPYRPQKTVLPAPALLPAAERRRASSVVKLTIAVGLEAIHAASLDAKTLPTVFASSGGDGDTCHAICEVLASSDRRISPTRFHNSVHNAAAGYWSIATGAMSAASVISGYDGSFSAGLLEACATVAAEQKCVLLLACDTSYPEPLHGTRPIADAMGVALVLSPQATASATAKIRIDLTTRSADVLHDAALERLRLDIPAARGLPLLAALARRDTAALVLDYLDDTRLAVAVTPC